MASTDEQRVRVRQRYTLHACMECQRRKKKCTGGDICRSCRNSGSECVYAPQSRSKKQKTTHLSTANSGSRNWSAIDLQPRPESSVSHEPPNESANNELASSAYTLEQDYEALKREMARMRNQERDRIATHSLLPPADAPLVRASPFSPAATSTSGSSPYNVFERHIRVVDRTSFSHQIDLLDRCVAREKGEESVTITPEEPEGENIDFEDLSAPLRHELDQVVNQTRLEDVDNVLQSLDIFFGSLRTHYPYINEAHFRSQFAAFLANDTSCMSRNVSIQFAALLNFMMAVARIMYDTCTQDDNQPGYKEFYRAEKLLGHTNWLEKANLMTIQILLVKSSYYLYTSRLNVGYDTIGIAVRLCFQLGLHNEPSWGETCSFYDRTYRQRVFWSVYCLHHSVSQNTGVPYLIREDDFDVERPRCVDDRMLYPTCPPLPDMPKASLVPFFLQIIKWAKLSSEIWDAMFGKRVKKRASADFVADMDAKIMERYRDMPPLLHWPPSQVSDTTPAFVAQQSFVLYLRILALRMLLRRGEMVSLRYEKRTAQLCIDIATEMVGAIELSYSSAAPKRTERYTNVLHLTGAMVPMICIIVRRNNDGDLVRPAIDLFKRALKIMEAISYGLAFARRTLRQLKRPVRVAKEIIETSWASLGQAEGAGGSASSSASDVRVGAQDVITTPTSLAQNHLWGGEVTMMTDSVREETGIEEWQKPSGGELVWEDLDLWNNIIMSTWQS